MGSRTFSAVQVIAAFWSKVDVRRRKHVCWNWKGGLSRGYGKFHAHDRMMQAHRFALELALGERISDEFEACHSCDNRLCCNPDHLFVGTRQINASDMVAKGRSFKNKGTLNSQSKLTEQAVRVIRAFATDRASKVKLGALFDVSVDCIEFVVKRETWRHV